MEMGTAAGASGKRDYERKAREGCEIGRSNGDRSGSQVGSRSSVVEPIVKAPCASFTPRHLTRVPALTPRRLQGSSLSHSQEPPGHRLPGKRETSVSLGRESCDSEGGEGAVGGGVQPENLVRWVYREKEEGGGARPPASCRLSDVGFGTEGGQTFMSDVSGADNSFSSGVITGDTPRIGQEDLDLVRNIAHAAARSSVRPQVLEASSRQHQPIRGHGAPSALPLFPNTAQEFLERLVLDQSDTGAPSASSRSTTPQPPPPRTKLDYVNVEQAAPRGGVKVPGASRSPRPSVHDPLRTDPPALARRHVLPASRSCACGCDDVEAKAAVILQVELRALYARGTAVAWANSFILFPFAEFLAFPPPSPPLPSFLPLPCSPALPISPSLSTQPSFFCDRSHARTHMYTRATVQ